MRFFGNGFVTMGDTIRDNPELVEKFVRAVHRGHVFALDDANRDGCSGPYGHRKPAGRRRPGVCLGACSPRCGPRPFPVDMSNGLGYQPPEVWEEWQAAQIAGGEMAAPL